jgi:hypothetical protein
LLPAGRSNFLKGLAGCGKPGLFAGELLAARRHRDADGPGCARDFDHLQARTSRLAFGHLGARPRFRPASHRTERVMNSPVSLNVPISRSHFEALVPPSRELVAGETGRNAVATAQGNIVFDSRLSLVRQHGTFTLAYSAAVQEGLEYFGNDHEFLAYKMVGSTALVLADPVSPPETREAIIRVFVQAKSDVCFC